jgi:hypothetical protein
MGENIRYYVNASIKDMKLPMSIMPRMVGLIDALSRKKQLHYIGNDWAFSIFMLG